MSIRRKSRGIDFTAIYATSAGLRPGDLGYGGATRWDVDLLSGYRGIFLPRANRAEIGGFFSLSDPGVIPVKFRAPGGTVCELVPKGRYKKPKSKKQKR